MTKIGNITVADKSPVTVMGIINVSPESFYKDSIRITTKEIAKAAIRMQREGAHIIDIGAMSTAPYLENNIPIEKEVERMKKAIRVIRKNCSLPISVDTPRSAVAREAINLEVDCLNDITGLKYDVNMACVVAESGLPIIMGAYARNRRINSQSPSLATGKILSTIMLLKDSLNIAKKFGIDNEQIIIDPSVGFFRANGKNPFFTLMKDIPWYIRDIEVISRLQELKKYFSNPVCVSVSRKSFIGKLFNLETEERLIPSLAFEIISTLNGAKIIRTHNVKETVQALTACEIVS
ncbi:MAG: dihydropteroate synthase [Nitrososphaeraceae archaeon]